MAPFINIASTQSLSDFTLWGSLSKSVCNNVFIIICLVMPLFNLSSEAMTMKYLGLGQVSGEKKLNQIDFG